MVATHCHTLSETSSLAPNTLSHSFHPLPWETIAAASRARRAIIFQGSAWMPRRTLGLLPQHPALQQPQQKLQPRPPTLSARSLLGELASQR